MPGKGKILMGNGPVKRPTPVKPKPSYEKLKDLAKKAGKILPVDKKYASDTNNKMKRKNPVNASPRRVDLNKVGVAYGKSKKPVVPKKPGKIKPVQPKKVGK